MQRITATLLILVTVSMKKIVPAIIPFLILLMCGCSDNAVKEDTKEQIEQSGTIERYKLYPTQNMWTFVKLDTRTGKMWLVQYSVKGDDERFEYVLNPDKLVTSEQKVNGRFELYETKNMYNFILLDRLDGDTWQVQWSFEKENRFVVPI